MELTKDDIKAIKYVCKAEKYLSKSLVLRSEPGAGTCKWEFRVVRENGEYSYAFETKAYFSSNPGKAKDMSGCYYIALYSTAYHAESILSLLRAGDEVRVEWYSGAKMTEKHRELGLYSDSVYLVIYRKGRRHLYLEFGTETSTNPQYRMIRVNN